MILDYFVYALYNVLMLFAIYLIIVKREYVRTHKKEIVLILITLLLYSQYRRYGARLFTPVISFTIENLPIHFCRFSALMTLVYLISGNKILKGFVYFQAGLGVFSVLLPGGYFPTMTLEWRSFTYMVDHFILAIMPFFLIFIQDYRVNRRDLIVSLVYSIVVPLAVLPWALATDYNAYYVLDGVFLRSMVGDNQALILTLMLLTLVLYNFLMYVVGQGLANVSERHWEHGDKLFRPAYPWYVVSGFLAIGLLISAIIVRPVPAYLDEDADAYLARPIAYFGEDIVVYAGTGPGDAVFYFLEPLHDDFLIEIYTVDSDWIHGFLADDHRTKFFDATKVSKNQVLIYLVRDNGTSNETAEVYQLDIITDYEDFVSQYERSLIGID
jgi:uncharacterized membrane protein YwaF